MEHGLSMITLSKRPIRFIPSTSNEERCSHCTLLGPMGKREEPTCIRCCMRAHPLLEEKEWPGFIKGSNKSRKQRSRRRLLNVWADLRKSGGTKAKKGHLINLINNARYIMR